MRSAVPITMALLLAAVTAGCQTDGTPGPVASDQTARHAVHRQVVFHHQRKPPDAQRPELAETHAAMLMLGVW